jgi:hypothetical protein
MSTNRADRPVGVTLAAIVLALMAISGLLIAALAVSALFLTRHPIIPPIPAVKIFVVCFDLLMLLILLWSIWTIIGLFQLKLWARFSILALGALDLCFFGVQSVGLLVVRSRYDFSMIAPGGIHVPTVLLEVAMFDALLALIGVWWLFYFSLSHVRLAFGGDARPGGAS